MQYQTIAHRVIAAEAEAILNLKLRINQTFDQACSCILQCQGRVIVTGMGKSGHIARKIAATFASTGTPTFFIHPGEASHGDLGMVTGKDVMLALSNSGETAEILTILPLIKRLPIPLIALTGRPKSTLAEAADIHLEVSVSEEACPLNLAPTSSTTAALVMGDALAIALLEARGFTESDFALSHPGGRLGKRLLLRVRDMMHTGARIPKVSNQAPLSEALVEMTQKGLGMTAVVNTEGSLCGIFTDGDLRRAFSRTVDVHTTVVETVMTRNGKTVCPDMLAAEALQHMEQYKINALLVTDEKNRLLGAFNMHDLLRAGVV